MIFAKELTCFKNPYIPACIHPFLTNRARSLQNTVTIETGISDFHNMVITVLNFFTKSTNKKSFNTGNQKLQKPIVFKKTE